MSLPESLDATHRAPLDALGKLKGAAFDRAYARMMVEDHEHDVREFQREAKRADDPKLRAWAAKPEDPWSRRMAKRRPRSTSARVLTH